MEQQLQQSNNNRPAKNITVDRNNDAQASSVPSSIAVSEDKALINNNTIYGDSPHTMAKREKERDEKRRMSESDRNEDIQEENNNNNNNIIGDQNEPNTGLRRFRRAASLVINLVRFTTEAQSPAHQRVRREIPVDKEPLHVVHGFQRMSKTGVLYVTACAAERGFTYDNKEWANLGQGAPETSHFPEAPSRKTAATITEFNSEYAPVLGIKALRQKVADLYNHRYRQGKRSKYTWENVAICSGGRTALTRLASALGDVNVGFFLPDYTAYEELLSIFKRVCPIPCVLNAKKSYKITYAELKREILDRGLSVILLSNPCNPTGQLVEGEALKDWVRLARTKHCSMIMDEFYSHYIYTHPDHEGKSISAAEYVDDVDKDPIIIVDGLTKNWRCPGWRIGWTVAPKEIISSLGSAGSFLDGGAPHPLQEAAIDLLDPEFVRQDAAVLQRRFKEKSDYVLARLEKMGIIVEIKPLATFYIWADLRKLPPPLDNGVSFFEAALDYKVIVVPGIFFDINPGKRREMFHSPYHSFVRISCGPPMETLKLGMDKLESMIAKYKKHYEEQVKLEAAQRQEQERQRMASILESIGALRSITSNNNNNKEEKRA